MKIPPDDRMAHAASRLLLPLEEGLMLLVLGNEEGRVTLASGGALRALPPEALLGCQGAELDRFVPGLAEAVGRALRGERSVVGCELGNRSYDLHSLPQAEGGSGFMVLGLEVTRHRHAELELSQKEREHQLLLARLPAIIWTTDAQLRVTSLMGAGTKCASFTPEMVLGRTVYELDFEGHRDIRLSTEHCRALAGEPRNYEVELGERSYRVFLESLEGAGVLGLAHDITELKQVERELRQSRADLAAILESAQDALWSVDASYRLVAANRTFFLNVHQAFGIEARLGDNPVELVATDYPEVASHWAELYGRALRGEHVNEEQDYVLQGEQRYIIFSLYPIRDGDSILGVAGFSKDITEHRRLEEQLRQSAKLEAIGQLASGVAHDFNNLLTVIFASCELMFRRLPPEAGLHRYLQSIHKAATQAAGLTRQLLAFGRKQPLRAEVLDPNEIMAEQAALCERLLGARIEFSLELDPTVGRIKMDRSHLQQSLLNLALNARDAMPHGGRLFLRTRTLVVPEGAKTEPPPGCWVVLEVQDTGSGMTAEVQARVFEPFFTTKEPGKGTGLGLSTTYGIVRQSGGHLQVESTPGGGSTFRIYLSCTDEPLAVEAPASSPTGLP
jgi:PAS domain S-box-containing protein